MGYFKNLYNKQRREARDAILIRQHNYEVDAILEIISEITFRAGVQIQHKDRCRWIIIDNIQYASWEMYRCHGDNNSKCITLLSDGRLVYVNYKLYSSGRSYVFNPENCDRIVSLKHIESVMDRHHLPRNLRSSIIVHARKDFGITKRKPWEPDKIENHKQKGWFQNLLGD